MAISPDQSAVLELLLSGDQSYSDLDDLFGLEEGETRERAQSALTELGGEDPDRNVGLTDYLLGQADPIGRADAVRHLRQDASDHGVASRIVTELESIAPGADLPKLPPARSGGRFMGGRSSQTAATGSGRASEPAASQTSSRRAALGSLSQQQTRLFAALGAAAVILIAIILGVSGVFSSDDEPAVDPPPDETTAQTDTEADPLDPSSPLPDGEEISRVPLAPVGGGDAAGAAIVGITPTGDQPYLDLVIENLQPAPEGKTYIAWFMFDAERGYPIPNPIMPERGSFEDRVAIPLEVAEPISMAQAIEISLTDPDDLVQEIETAAQEGTFAIVRPGRTVLRGAVPQPEGQGSETPAPEGQPAPGEGQGQPAPGGG